MTQRETGGRDITCGHDSFQVTGDGHGSQPLGGQPFSPQPPEPKCQLVIRSGQPANLSTDQLVVHSGPRVLRSSCPRIIPPGQSSGLPMLPPLSSASLLARMSTCQHASKLSVLANRPTDQWINSCASVWPSGPQVLVSLNYAPCATPSRLTSPWPEAPPSAGVP